MSNSTTSGTVFSLFPPLSGRLPDEIHAAHWFVVHTRSRHEKLVAQQLGKSGIEHLLPVYQSVHRWKDRTKKLMLPLFPGYLFVHIHRPRFVRVLEIPGVVKLIGFPRPQAIADGEIIQIQQWSLFPHKLGPCPYLQIGRRVRICRGPLAGLEGILLRKKSNLCIVMSVELIQRSVAVEIDGTDIIPC